jgi:hypothetical protein
LIIISNADGKIMENNSISWFGVNQRSGENVVNALKLGRVFLEINAKSRGSNNDLQGNSAKSSYNVMD